VPLLKRQPEIFPADLFGPPPVVEEGDGCGQFSRAELDAKPWWIAYTRSRQEKRLARHLLQWPVPYYLPQRAHRLRAGDHWRTSYLPLFTGYLFFRGSGRDRLAALKSNLIVRFVNVTDSAGLERELHSLWLLQCTGAPLVPHPYIGPGDEVVVTEGALRGYRGTVLREKGKYRLVVSITLLRQSVAADLEREVVAPAGLRNVS
jgi:transcriptional antiterminator RfaH